jgi:hypothetical protein
MMKMIQRMNMIQQSKQQYLVSYLNVYSVYGAIICAIKCNPQVLFLELGK